MIVSHVVWGAALGLLHCQLAGETRERNRDRLPSPEVLAAARATGV